MSQKNKETLSFSKITPLNWAMLGGYLVLAIIGIWQAWLPFFAERHYRDGYNFDAEKRTKFAIEEYETAVSLAPWESQYQMELVKSYVDFSHTQPDKANKVIWLQKAIDMSERMIDLDNKNPWYKNRLATIYLELAEVLPEKTTIYAPLAEQLTRDAANSDTQNPLFQLNLAYFLHRKGNIEEAIRLYNRVLEIDDRIVEARYNLADIYRKQGNIQETLNQYLLAVKRVPQFPNLNLAIASTYIQINQNIQAIPYLEAELKINPSQFEVLKNLAALYHQNKQWDDACRIYEQLMRYYPGQTDIHQFYMQALVNAGKVDDAILKLTQYLDLHPSDPIATHQLTLIKAYLHKK